MNIITLDFETYYDQQFSLSKLTTEEYIRSPLFETIGFAYKINDGDIQWVSGDYQTIKAVLDALPWHNHLLLAQHTAFDGAILNWIFGVTPVGYLDTKSMANAMHGLQCASSLAALANFYGFPPKGDEVVRALGKHRIDFTPQELHAYGEYCRHDVELTYLIFQEMMRSFPKPELRVIDTTIRMFAEPRLMLDEHLLIEDLMNIRGRKRGALVQLMTLLGVKTEEQMRAQLMSNEKFATLLRSKGIEPPTKISARTGKETYAFAKTDEEFTALEESEDPIVATMVTARLSNKSTINETRTESYAEIAGRGAYPFSLTYPGAKTSQRWSGFDTNPQNLPRKSTLRNSIMAPEGHTLVVADLSNIELRLGMWLARQYDAVQQLASGMDLYRAFASEAFNLAYEDIPKDSDTRFIAKECCLSLIYCTGAEKLRNTIRIRSRGSKTISLNEAERLKNVYREKYPSVVAAWREGERILEWLLHRETHTAYGILPVLGDRIIKPNGLWLTYPELRVSQGAMGNEWLYTELKGRARIDKRVYGGKCYQRIVQSLARDIIAVHTSEIAKQYWVAGLVHDEVIVIAKEDEAEDCAKYIKQVMRTPPSWAPDLPLDCEVGIGHRYGEAK